MATLKLSLDKRRQKKDLTYPLVFRVTIQGKSTDFPVGYSILEEYWNSSTCRIKKTLPEFKILNKKIKDQHIMLLTKLSELESSTKHHINSRSIKSMIDEKPKIQQTVAVFWENEIVRLQKIGRSGGSLVHRESLNALSRVKNLEIPFEVVTYNFLMEIETELLGRGLKLNTIGVYFRSLRTIFNRAIYSEEVSVSNYPFKAFKIKKSPTIPRPLSIEEMRLYFSANIDPDSYLYDSWLIGKLMFMLIGINYRDLVLIQEAQIQQGRLNYIRSKTKKSYSIKLLDDAVEILKYFASKSNSMTIFDRISDLNLKERETLPLKVRQSNKVFNAHLNKIGKQIGTKEKLTGYCFRYSWANIAKTIGYSKDLIAEGLGHEYGNSVTGIYLNNYGNEVLDEMNSNINTVIFSNNVHL